MRWSYKGLVTIFAVFGILFGVTLACGSTESETPGSPAPQTVAATAEDTATSADSSSSASAEPEAADDTEPAGKVESLLSGETLARYRALPEEYRVALDAYALFGVSDALLPTVVAEKMALWPDSPEPIQDLLDADRYAMFEELTATHPNPSIGDTARLHRHAFFFLGYYPYVLLDEDTVEGRKQAFANLLDAMADRFESGKKPEVPQPRLDGLIVPSAMAALDALGPRLRDAIAVPQPNFSIEIDALAGNVVFTEVMLLKSEPGLEVPALAAHLSAEDQGLFNDLPANMREDAERRYAHGVLSTMIGMATSEDHPKISLPSDEVLAEIAQQESEFAQMLAK